MNHRDDEYGRTLSAAVRQYYEQHCEYIQRLRREVYALDFATETLQAAWQKEKDSLMSLSSQQQPLESVRTSPVETMSNARIVNAKSTISNPIPAGRAFQFIPPQSTTPSSLGPAGTGPIAVTSQGTGSINGEVSAVSTATVSPPQGEQSQQTEGTCKSSTTAAGENSNVDVSTPADAEPPLSPVRGTPPLESVGGSSIANSPAYSDTTPPPNRATRPNSNFEDTVARTHESDQDPASSSGINGTTSLEQPHASIRKRVRAEGHLAAGVEKQGDLNATYTSIPSMDAMVSVGIPSTSTSGAPISAGASTRAWTCAECYRLCEAFGIQGSTRLDIMRRCPHRLFGHPHDPQTPPEVWSLQF